MPKFNNLLERDAQIIEAHIGHNVPIVFISLKSGLSEVSIEEIINKYYTSEEFIGLKSKINLSPRDWYIFQNWQKLSLEQMGEVLNIPKDTIMKIAKRNNFPKKKQIRSKLQEQPNRLCALILNTETGIYYNSALKAAQSIRMPYSSFKERLSGKKKNDTPFIKA